MEPITDLSTDLKLRLLLDDPVWSLSCFSDEQLVMQLAGLKENLAHGFQNVAANVLAIFSVDFDV